MWGEMPARIAYAAIIGMALVIGLLLRRRARQPVELSRRQRWGLGLGAFCGAMLGAKAPFALVDPLGMVFGTAWLSDGKTIMTGLVGGYCGVELAKYALEIRAKTGDSFAMPVAAAVSVGRLACFAIGCCRGSPSGLPWACDFGDGIPRHPTQLYEASFHLLMALALWQFARRGLFAGQRIKLYFLCYFVYRFGSEFLRPEPRVWLNLTIYQWASLLFSVVFLHLWRQDAVSRRISPA